MNLKRGESHLKDVLIELAASETRSTSYLELLRTRAWRRGFDQNMMRDLDAQVGRANAAMRVLESERDRLRSELAAHAAHIEQLQSKAQEREREHAAQVERSQERLRGELNSADSERARLAAELAARDLEHAAQFEQLRTEHAAQLGRIQAELDDRDERIGVLISSLKEARRAIPTFEGDVKRLTEELAAKIGMADALDRQMRKVAALLEWTRGALEECDLLVRQLGPCESANVLAQIQNSIIKRLGFVCGGPAASAADDCRAVPGTAYRAGALIKIDGSRITTHALGARTRIGRSTTCELHLDSSSVSRYHALVMVGPRYTVIEDLNSTNGVLVNGRRVKRITLNDGDTLTIGDTYFRCLAPLHDIWTRPDPKNCVQLQAHYPPYPSSWRGSC